MNTEVLRAAPETEIYSPEAIDRRFDELLELAVQRNLAPQTLGAIKAVRQRFTTEVAGAEVLDVATFDAKAAEFTARIGDPKYDAELREAAQIEHAQTLLYGEDPMDTMESILTTPAPAPEAPMAYANWWMLQSGIDNVAAPQLRPALDAALDEWMAPAINEEADAHQQIIDATPVFTPGVDPAAIAESVRTKYGCRGAEYYDAMHAALDSGIAALQSEAGSQAAPAKTRRGLVSLLQRGNGHTATSDMAADQKLLAGFFKVSHEFSVLSKKLAEGDDVNSRAWAEFQDKIGYGAFLEASRAQTEKSRRKVLEELTPDDVKEYLEHYDAQIDMYWHAKRQRYQGEAESVYAYDEDPQAANAGPEVYFAEHNAHNHMYVPVRGIAADQPVPLNAPMQRKLFNDSADKYWDIRYSEPVIDALFDNLAKHAVRDQAEIDPHVVLRLLTSVFDPDRVDPEENPELFQWFGEFTRDINDLAERLASGECKISVLEGYLDVLVGQLPEDEADREEYLDQ